jgi:uncharacterized Fe-S center protein
VIIADGLSGKHMEEVEINRKHFKKVNISGDIQTAGSMIVLSHVKGHDVAGFGGAIKKSRHGLCTSTGKPGSAFGKTTPGRGQMHRLRDVHPGLSRISDYH